MVCRPLLSSGGPVSLQVVYSLYMQKRHRASRCLCNNIVLLMYACARCAGRCANALRAGCALCLRQQHLGSATDTIAGAGRPVIRKEVTGRAIVAVRIATEHHAPTGPDATGTLGVIVDLTIIVHAFASGIATARSQAQWSVTGPGITPSISKSAGSRVRDDCRICGFGREGRAVGLFLNRRRSKPLRLVRFQIERVLVTGSASSGSFIHQFAPAALVPMDVAGRVDTFGQCTAEHVMPTGSNGG